MKHTHALRTLYQLAKLRIKRERRKVAMSISIHPTSNICVAAASPKVDCILSSDRRLLLNRVRLRRRPELLSETLTETERIGTESPRNSVCFTITEITTEGAR